MAKKLVFCNECHWGYIDLRILNYRKKKCSFVLGEKIEFNFWERYPKVVTLIPEKANKDNDCSYFRPKEEKLSRWKRFVRFVKFGPRALENF